MKDQDHQNNPNDFLNDLEIEDIKQAYQKQSQSMEVSPPEHAANRKLTQGQRFFLAVLFFVLVLIFGFFIMLVTGSMVIPI